MIYLNLMGGLGNQLFQYAAGLTFLDNTSTLYIYKAHSNSHSKADYRYLFKRGVPLDSKTPSYTLQLGAFAPWDPSQYPRPIRLNGYFQNLPSLTSLPLVIQDLRESLGLGPVPTCPSVPRGKTFIHVRRGDYIKYSHLYGGVGEDYYKKAMALWQAGTEFIVLSDDPDWCRTQAWLAGCEIIDEPDELKALAIMGSCEGAIIANSTFSWWGAMISAKKVVYPSKWFSNVKPDLFPESWICI